MYEAITWSVCLVLKWFTCSPKSRAPSPVRRSGNKAPERRAHRTGSLGPCEKPKTSVTPTRSNRAKVEEVLRAHILFIPGSNYQLVMLRHQSEVTRPLWLPVAQSFSLPGWKDNLKNVLQPIQFSESSKYDRHHKTRDMLNTKVHICMKTAY